MSRAGVLLVVLGVLAGCGGSGGGGSGSSAGTWVVDVATTFGVAPSQTPGEDHAVQGVRVRFAPTAHRLELRADGTFRLTSAGPDATVVDGAWTVVASGVSLVAATVDGAPASAEEGVPDVLVAQGDRLVLEAPGRSITWKRSP